MFTKLAMRNVKRQLGNYLIYFMTVSLTVSFIFAINNVIYSPQLLQWVEEASSMKIALIGLTIFISLIVAFVLAFSSSAESNGVYWSITRWLAPAGISETDTGRERPLSSH